MQKSKLPNLITILVLTLITVLMWIGFTIYSAITKTPESSVPKNISDPIVPTLDAATLSNVQSALFFNESQIPEITFSGTPSASLLPIATPEPIATPIATQSALPSASPSATPTIP